MKQKNKKRIFIIEPNLTSRVGHSLDFVENIKKSLQKNNIEVIIILSKSLSKSLLPDGDRIISNKCFEGLTSRGEIFCKDLQAINSKYKFRKNDKVLVSAAYTNEIMGISMYQTLNSNAPAFYLIIHQLYPPTDNFLKTHSLLSRYFLERKLQKLVSLSFNKINLFCTDCNQLKNTLSKNGKYKIKCVTVPYKAYNQRSETIEYDLIFIGDNRFEKSLYVLTQYLKKYPQKTAFLQVTPPRGYPKNYKKMLLGDLKYLSKSKKVTIWHNELSRKKIRQVIAESRIILLPYHPLSYKKRVSGLFPEALFAGKPMIATHNTWVGALVDRNGLGFTFKFSKNTKNNIISLEGAISEVEKNYNKVQNNIRNILPSYQEKYSFDNFIKNIGLLND